MAYTTIDDPSAYFQTALYTGNGTSTNAITNDGNSDLQPDWLWLKARSIVADNIIFDSTRGTNKRISANTDSAEETQAFYSSFDTDGFTLGDSNANVNQSGATYVCWQWKANGGTTSSNTDGSVTSTVQANTTAGFSIVTYTGTGSATTVGHGLGVKPELILIKNRNKSTGEGWAVYHGANTSAPETDGLHLNLTNATNDDTDFWNDQAPTTTTFGISGDDRSGGSYNYVAYVFNSVQGYSKFGSYTATGNANGPFVYTGFKPAWVMVKSSSRTNSETNWVIWDNKRNGFNPNVQFFANQNFTEGQRDDGGGAQIADIDILSNGFKQRNSTWGQNGSSGDTYIYIAFAEHPFVGSDGVPTTAR